MCKMDEAPFSDMSLTQKHSCLARLTCTYLASRHSGVVVKGSALQSVDLSSIPLLSVDKDLKNSVKSP